MKKEFDYKFQFFPQDYDLEELKSKGIPLMSFRLPNGEIIQMPANHFEHPEPNKKKIRRFRGYKHCNGVVAFYKSYRTFMSAELKLLREMKLIK